MQRRLMLVLTLAAVVGPLAAISPLWAQAVRNVPRISIDEVKALMAKKQVLLIDVRDAESFAEGHMPGAIHIPLADVVRHADKLKNEKRTIVTYCA